MFAFYGNYWNKAGVTYQAFGFKHLEKDKALEFLTKIDKVYEKNKEYLRDNYDNNNVVFKYEDMTILIWSTATQIHLRIFWNGFDSTWENDAFNKSKSRFAKKIK